MKRSLVPVAVAVCLVVAAGIRAQENPSASHRAGAKEVTVGGAPDRAPAAPRLSMVATPLSFEPNVGQDKSGARFLAHGPGYALQLEPSRARMQFGGSHDSALTMELVNASPETQMNGENALPGKSNYFLTSDRKTWFTNIPTYSKVRYRTLYPGVDALFYGNPNRLEFDFLIQPEANPQQIAMKLAGAEQAVLNDAGDLVLGAGKGEIQFLRPVAWQTSKDGKSRETVQAGYRLERAADGEPVRVSFSLGAYDRSRELVIDPVAAVPALNYSEYLSGPYVSAVAADNSGDTFVAGSNNGGTPAFYVTEFNSSGAVVYNTTVGGGTIWPYRIALDGSGNAYIVGETAGAGTTLPTSANAFQSSITSYYNGFLVEIASGGASVPYATFIGATDANYSAAQGLAVETISGTTYAYVGGWTYSAAFPTTAGVYQSAHSGTAGSNYNGWVAQFKPSAATPAASLVYSTYLGTPSSEVFALGADSTGDTYAAMYATTSAFPTTSGAFKYSGYDSASGGVYVTKLNTAGTALVYSAYLGYGVPYGIAVELAAASPSAYIAGTVAYADWPTTSGAYQTTYAGGFAVKLSSDGSSEVYSTFLGGPSSYAAGTSVVPWSIALPNGCSSSCNAYISGFTDTNDFPAINAIQSFNPGVGGNVGFVVELNATGGSALFSTYLSGLTQGVWNGYTASQAYGFTPNIAVDSGGNMSVVGDLGGSPQDFPITIANANPKTAFLAKIVPSGAPYLWMEPTSVNFGSQPVGVSTNTYSTLSLSARQVVLRNLSATAATLASILASPASIFSETDNCGGTIPAGGYCTLTLAFTPAAPGARTGTVTVASNATDTPVIALSGTGADQALIQASVSSLTFANQTVGTASTAQSVTLTNLSDETAALNIYTSSTGFSELNNCPSQLAPGNSCVVNVTFNPTSVGLWSDNLTVTYSGPTVQVPLSGTGIPSAGSGTVTLLYPSLNFGDEPVGTTSGTQVDYIENEGSVPVTIQSIVAAGDYTLGSTNCTLPGQLNPQTYCYVYVTFTPTTTGTRTGTLTFTDSASGSPQAVALTGTGLPAVQTVNFYPENSLVFPNQPVGYQSGTSIIYLQNAGTEAITIDRVLVTGDFQITGTNCPASSVAGQLYDGSGVYSYCYVYVAFTPTATGFRSGTLSFVDSASNSPQTVTLSGTGVPDSGTLALNPTQLDYSTTQVVGTTTATQLVQLVNPGNTPITVNSYSTGVSDFAVTNYNCPSLPFAINPAGNCYVQVSFTPTAAGARTGTLTVSSTAGSQTVALNGGGVTASEAIAFTPASPLNSGSFLVGAHSGSGGASAGVAGDLVSIRNTGTSPVTFSASPAISGTNSGDFSLYNPSSCGVSGTKLQANASCVMWITFTPGATGSRTANLTFTDDAPGSPQTLVLDGTGLAATPSSSLSNGLLSFDNQVQGTTSPENSYVYFYNNSGASVTLGNVVLTGNFLVPAGTCNAAVLPNGGSCYEYLEFAPTSPGYLTGTITIKNSGGTELASAPLEGFAPAPITTALLDPSTVNFTANQVVGTTSSYQQVTLYNTGNVSMTLGTMTGTNLGTAPASEFSLYIDECSGVTVQPAGSCSIYVTFTPNAAGARTGTAVFHVTYLGGTTQNFTANLTGTGVAEVNSATVSPSTGSFVDQTVGTTTTYNVQLILTNNGNRPFTVGTLTGTNFSSSASSVFSTSGTLGGADSCSGATVQVAGTCSIYVRFTPSAAGTQTGSVTFPVTFADTTTASPVASLTGNGVAVTKTLQFTPASLQFPVQIVSTTSAQYILTVKNTGNAAVTIGTDTFSTNFALGPSGDGCSGTNLAYNASCNIYVKFSPTTTGPLTGTLTVADNATGGPHAIALSGTGIPANQQIAVSQNPVNFGNQPANSTSAPQVIYITNQGDTTVSSFSTSLTGTNTADFEIYSNTCGASLGARAVCAITVKFIPQTGTSGALTATVALTTSVSGETAINIVLNGTAVTAGPAASLQPSPLTFATVQNVGTTSAAQSFSVTDTGSASLTITNVALGGANASEFSISSDGCSGATLTTSQYCTVFLKFSPALGGTRTATVSVTDNASGSPQTLTVSGTGHGIPVAALSPASVPFGSSNIGTATAAQNVTLTNTGTDVLNIASVALTGANPGDFAISSNGCGATLSATVNTPHPNCVIAVTFTPTAGGSRGASLTVTDNANNATGTTQSTALTGTGVPVPNAGLSTGTLPSFGSVNIGTTSTNQTVTVSNTGTGPLTIASIVVGGTNPGDFGQTNNCGATLNNGATCTISVTFTPSAAGARSATITLTDNANNVTGATQVVNVSGTGVGVPQGATTAPSSLTFTNQNVNSTSAAQGVTLTNNGTGALTIASIAISGTNAGDFAKSTTCGATVASGGNCTISVTFTPTALGSRTATLVITDNAGNVTGSTQSVTLNGTGVGVPNAGVSPPSVPFGSQNVGTTSASQPVTLNNTTGTGPLTISGISFGGTNPADFGQTNNCGTSVAIGASCTIHVTFTPVASGSRSGTLIISDNSGNTASSQTVGLTGTGVGVPNAGLSTGTLPSFGSVNIGTTSAAQTVTVSNTGTGPLTIASIVVGGTNPGDFGKTSDCGATLNNGATCSISVTFTPTAAGARSATITLTDNAGNVTGTTQVVNASGTGVAVPGVTASPSSLTFTNQNVNSTSAALVVTLTNNGSGALTIASIAISGTNAGDFGKTTTCGATLAGSGGTCTISVTFTPTVSGSRTATLVVTDNAGNVTGSTQSVTLNGTGTGVPNAGVSPPSVPFGSQNVGSTSSSQPVTLNNTTGTGPLAISGISFGGTNPADFGQTNNCGTSVAIGASCTINVTFAPTAVGGRSGTLIVSDNSGNTASSQTVNLTGTGVGVAVASPSPGTLPAFNSTPVGVTSSAQQVTVTDTGTGALAITSIAIGGTNPGDFAQTNNCLGTLSPGANCTISVTFTPAATGSRSGTLIITDNSGNVSGTQQNVGLSGTGATAPGTPVPVSASPINGSGTTQTFTLTYLDDNGISDVKNLYVLFNPTSSMAYGCDVSYYQTATSNRIYLANDAGTGWLPSVSVASSTPLANSQCTVTGSGITSSGNELTLSLTITFAAGFSGQKNVYMEAIGASGNSGWVLQGTWTTAARQTLTAGSISPINGTGLSQTFSLSFPDANGVSDIGKGFVLFNASLTGASACYVEFVAPKSLYLRNDANSAWSSPITVGSATPLSNSQCTLTGSSLTAAPGGYTLGLSLTFSGTFTGSKNVYMEAEPAVGSATAFKLEGTWTP